MEAALESRLDQLVRRHGELRDALSASGLSGGDFAKLSKEYSELSPIVDGIEALRRAQGELAAAKEAAASITGRNVFARLKYESGVHRVQRVPETEASGRIHTSAATVAVLPEAEEVDVRIEDKDLRIDVFRSSGPGGQSVNTTDSAVR